MQAHYFYKSGAEGCLMACPDRTGEGAVTTEVEMVVKSLENKAASRHQKLETSLGNLSWSLRGPSSSAHPWCVCVCVLSHSNSL